MGKIKKVTTKRQKIVVITQLRESDRNLADCGRHLAATFRKDLCLFYPTRQNTEQTGIETTLQGLIPEKETGQPPVATSILVRHVPPGKIALTMADEEEAIIIIAAASSFSILKTTLQASPVPFLFVDEKSSWKNIFRKIITPVDLRSQIRDVLLWTIYFSKYFQAEAIVIGANDKSSGNLGLVKAHLNAFKKSALKFNLNHKIYRGRRNSLSVQYEALEYALAEDADLLVLLGSSVVTPLEWIFGLPEKKIIRKAGTLPVLVINPAREVYALCE